jgi:hypothetical protein
MYVGRIPHTQYGAYAINVQYELLITEDIRFGQWKKRVFTGGLQSPLYVYNKDTAWLWVDSSVLFTEDGARTWDTLCTGCIQDDKGIFSDYNNCIFFVTPKVGWIGGITGRMEQRNAIFFHTEDGGKTWTRQENVTLLPDPAFPPPRTLIGILKIRAISTTEAWALDERGLLHTTDGGNTWVECLLPQAPPVLYDMYCDTNSRWVVGQAGGIWKAGKDVISSSEPYRGQRLFNQDVNISNIRVNSEGIAFNLVSPGQVTLRVFTITGRTLSTITLFGKSGRNTVLIKNCRFTAGVYCYSVSLGCGKENVTGRFILSKGR